MALLHSGSPPRGFSKQGNPCLDFIVVHTQLQQLPDFATHILRRFLLHPKGLQFCSHIASDKAPWQTPGGAEAHLNKGSTSEGHMDTLGL
jgi:hypothetical protein